MTLGGRLRQARKYARLTQEELAARSGVSQQLISSLERDKQESTVFVVELATACGVRPQWLASGAGPMTEDAPGVAVEGALGIAEPSMPPHALDRPDSIDIPVLDVHGSMGNGILVPDHETVIGSMRLSMQFIRMNLPVISKPSALRITTGHGDSMYPTFRDGDPLIVDTGVTSIQTDAVYMFIRDDELFIKRLQRLSGGALKIISDNRQLYDSETLSPAQAERLVILARVLFAWRGERL